MERGQGTACCSRYIKSIHARCLTSFFITNATSEGGSLAVVRGMCRRACVNYLNLDGLSGARARGLSVERASASYGEARPTTLFIWTCGSSAVNASTGSVAVGSILGTLTACTRPKRAEIAHCRCKYPIALTIRWTKSRTSYAGLSSVIIERSDARDGKSYFSQEETTVNL